MGFKNGIPSTIEHPEPKTLMIHILQHCYLRITIEDFKVKGTNLSKEAAEKILT
jgi:hypothetical protein